MSITTANLYVATLFRVLRNQFPDVEIGAFLDDRNFATKNLSDVEDIISTIKDFDACAGHKTNLSKSVVFANPLDARKRRKQIAVKGNTIPVATAENMVGHQISAMKKKGAPSMPRSVRTTLL